MDLRIQDDHLNLKLIPYLKVIDVSKPVIINPF